MAGFKQYRLGAAGVGLMLGLSMLITIFLPSFDLRSGVTTEMGLRKQLSVGYDAGFSYNDPNLFGPENKPVTVILDKDPSTGAKIDPPMTAFVFKAGTYFAPNVRHPDELGEGVEDLSIQKGRIREAKESEGAVFTIREGEWKGDEVHYIEDLTATRGWQPNDVLSKVSDAHKRYIGQGKTIFVAQGCWWCHTLLPEETQDWQAFGAPPYLGDFNGEMPTAFGSDRKGPDLLHVASRNSSREWLTMHFFNPRLVQPHSIMPRFDYLWGKVDAEGKPIDYAKWREEYVQYREGKRVYPPDVPDPNPNSPARALIDWVLSLK